MTRAWLTLVLFLVSASALAQTHTPKLIDVHMHYDGEQGILDQVLVKLEGADGIAFLLTTQKGFPQATKFIQEHPDRFIGFGDIKLDDPDVLHQIDRFHAAGFRGLGEITMTRKPYDDPAYWPIYDRADKYHMILLFHTGIVNRLHPQEPADVSFDRSRVTRLDLIARHWPNLIIIGAHLGNPDYEEAGEIGRWNPNLYLSFFSVHLLVDSGRQSPYAGQRRQCF
jgi:predicted TIM-barrel fold metal-dependent hydrolase